MLKLKTGNLKSREKKETIGPTQQTEEDVAATKNQRVPGACNRSPGSKLLSITATALWYGWSSSKIVSGGLTL
jgi:hypothetical protein